MNKRVNQTLDSKSVNWVSYGKVKLDTVVVVIVVGDFASLNSSVENSKMRQTFQVLKTIFYIFFLL